MISKILEITIPFVVSARISHYNDLKSESEAAQAMRETALSRQWS